MAKVLYVFRPGRADLIARHKLGESPRDMLYGMADINADEFAVSFIERNDSRWDWRRRLFHPLDGWLSRRLRMGFSLHFALQHLRDLRRADCIVSTADVIGLPIALLKWLRLIQTPVIYVSQGLTDRLGDLPPESRTFRLLRFWYGCWLRSLERVIVLGEGAIDPLVTLFHLEASRVAAAPFGVDERFWTPGGARGDFILSVGSDPARDYAMLLSAIDDLPTKIITRLPINDAREHVQIASDVTDVELRELYRTARMVVTPLFDVAQPSGQSASLQAMACGAAVILSDTRGLWEREHMIHMENCYLVQPGDVPALRAAMRFLWDNPGEAERIGANARRSIEGRYNCAAFAAMLEDHMRNLLA
jgi:glycosyltransferase involved in cell wall biosynthesis